MLMTSIRSIIYSILASLQFADKTFIFHLLTRGFVNGGFPTFIASNYPFYLFGKLFGLPDFFFGTIDFSQFGIFQLALNFDTNFYFINIG